MIKYGKLVEKYVEIAPWVITILGIGPFIGFAMKNLRIVGIFIIIMAILTVPYGYYVLKEHITTPNVKKQRFHKEIE